MLLVQYIPYNFFVTDRIMRFKAKKKKKTNKLQKVEII